MLILGGLLAAVYLFGALAACFAPATTPRSPVTSGLRTAAPLALAGLAIVMGFGGTALVELSAIAAPWAEPAAILPEPAP